MCIRDRKTAQLDERARKKPWRRVVVFCDNAGADVMGMALLARTLVELGGLRDTKVALAANEWAALNDVTARETRAFLETVVQSPASVRREERDEEPAFSGDETLRRQIERGAVTAVSSGQMSTLLDLNRCGPELNDWVETELRAVPAGEEWLVVFDGMGRSLESNWDVAGAMAPGVNTYIFANMYGVGKRTAATSLLAATALSILTIWIWLMILP